MVLVHLGPTGTLGTPTVINKPGEELILYFCNVLCPSLLSPRAFSCTKATVGHSEKVPVPFCCVLFLPFHFAGLKFLQPSVTGLSYLCSSLLSSCGLRNSRIRSPACVPLPPRGTCLGWCVVLGSCCAFTLERAQALHCWRGISGMLYLFLPREGVPWQLLGVPWSSLQISLVVKCLGGEAHG